jgi:hypothetical protein
MQRRPILVIHVVAIHGLEEHDLSLGQIGGLIEQKAPVADVSF